MGNIWKWFVLVLFLAGCGGNNDAPIPTPDPSPPPYTGETCMSANALLLAGGTPLIIVDAAKFDGTNDYMLRGADLTGIADGKSGILSFWYRVDGGDGTARWPMSNSASVFSGIQIRHHSDNKIIVSGNNAAGTSILVMSTSAITASATWLHILSSWDLATGVLNLYVTDVSDKTVVTNTNDTIDYAAAAALNWSIGSNAGGTNKINGCLAEFYFAPNQYLDFSDVNNRRKFISAGGKPVHLGVDGSLPTGTAPIIYQHLDNGEAVANFATNRGTGGNFTITGTLDTASTSPSD